MLTSVKYGHEPGIYLWPVPFPFSSESQITVRLQGPDGQERELSKGEYYFQDQNVVYLLQSGYALILCLNVSPSEVLQANQARAISPAVQVMADTSPVVEQPAPVVIEQPVEDGRLAAMQAQLDELAAEREQALIAARAAEADNQIAAIKTQAASGADEIAQSKAQALTAIQEKSAEAAKSIQVANASLQAAASTASAAIDEAAQAKVDVQAVTDAAIARLEGKIAELEARLTEAGRQQEAGIATLAEEAVTGVARDVGANAGIAVLAADNAKDAVDDAAKYAAQSGSYAAQAQNHAADAKLAVADCKLVTAQGVENCKRLATQSENAAAKSLFWKEQAEGLTRTALDTANSLENAHWLVSNATPNGGVRAVASEAELTGAASGSYIINPCLRMTPTPAYGVWPVDSLDGCDWDGFFILGPEFDGLKPNGPTVTPMPEEPDDPNPPVTGGEPANSHDWLPCDHEHEEAANA